MSSVEVLKNKIALYKNFILNLKKLLNLRKYYYGTPSDINDRYLREIKGYEQDIYALKEALLALERIKDFEEKKLIAKQCLEYQGFKCNNKSCLNWFCPLNKRKVLKNE